MPNLFKNLLVDLSRLSLIELTIKTNPDERNATVRISPEPGHLRNLKEIPIKIKLSK